MNNFNEQIAEDEQLLRDMPPAISAQRMHIRAIEQQLRSAKSILRRMSLALHDLKKHLIRVKQQKSQYPSKSRRYTKEHFGDVWERIEEEVKK